MAYSMALFVDLGATSCCLLAAPVLFLPSYWQSLPFYLLIWCLWGYLLSCTSSSLFSASTTLSVMVDCWVCLLSGFLHPFPWLAGPTKHFSAGQWAIPWDEDFYFSMPLSAFAAQRVFHYHLACCRGCICGMPPTAFLVRGFVIFVISWGWLGTWYQLTACIALLESLCSFPPISWLDRLTNRPTLCHYC